MLRIRITQNLEKVLKQAHIAYIFLACHLQIYPDQVYHFDADPDPNPTFHLDADPCGSVSATLPIAELVLSSRNQGSSTESPEHAVVNSPLLHGSLPESECPQHVPLLVHKGGAQQLHGVDPLLLPHQVPLTWEQRLNEFIWLHVTWFAQLYSLAETP